MITQQDITAFGEAYTKAKSVLIVTHERPTFDSIGSSLALYLGLIGAGKSVMIACPDQVTVGLSDFIGVNKFVSEIGKKNLIISLDYTEGSIEKVSYNIEGNKFNLVIEPREGFPPFRADNVEYKHGGATADLIVAVDTIHLGGLRHLYEQDKNLYASKTLVNIDSHPNNVSYGQINIVYPEASSTAEVMWEILAGLQIRITEDMATNILNALYETTELFRSKRVSVRTFEIAAECLKAGAVRFSKKKTDDQMQYTQIPGFDGNKGIGADVPTAVRDESKKEDIRPDIRTTVDIKDQSVKSSGKTPADWLKPKIFKSSQQSDQR